MIIDEDGVKEIHGDGCFFDTLVKDQINVCHNTSFGKSDIRTITKEEVMVISLYEIWAGNRDDTVAYEKIRENSWTNFHKKRNYQLEKNYYSYLEIAQSSSITFILLNSCDLANAGTDNIVTNTKDYDNTTNKFKTLKDKHFL